MSQFLIGSTSQSATSTPAYADSPIYTSDDDEDTLPYPAELSRKDFLAPDFDPQTYLSSLRNRHQTLEDLRSDLRQRSQLLNRELLDLVNGNYEEFLSLGGDLRGGDERVEGVKVGLLGFQREIEGVRKVVVERRAEMVEFLGEKKRIRGEVVIGMKLLEVDGQIEELEVRLGMRSGEGGEDLDDELEEEDEEEEELGVNATAASSTVRRLGGQAEQYLLVARQIDRIGPDHPFLMSLRPRLDGVRKTLLLDLSAALRRAQSTGDQASLMTLSKIFGDLDAQREALKILKGG